MNGMRRLRQIVTRHRFWRPLRLARQAYKARTSAFPDWSRVIGGSDWAERRAMAAQGKRVLIGTSIGVNHAAASLESLLAIALTLRGAAVEVLLCDRALPACMACQHDWYPDRERFLEHGPARDLCRVCYEPAKEMIERLGLRVRRYGEFLTPTDYGDAERLSRTISLGDIKDFKRGGIPVGEHAWSGALRFFASGTIDQDPAGEGVLRRYFSAAILSAIALERLFEEGRFEVACFHHGIYVPQGVIADVAHRAGVRVVTWNPAYRKGCFIFSHNETYHHALMSEPTELWETMPWSAAARATISEYLESRRTGAEDWITFQHRDPSSESGLAAVAFDQPTIGLLTNVVWDAQLHYPANAFASMLDWLSKTIAWFDGRPDLQLLIRVHPAEVTGAFPSRQKVVDFLAQRFPELPRNVHVVGPENSVSTYDLMERCNAVLIYGTKTGVELAGRGIPVIVAGEAWIRNKGMTIDATSEAAYFEILELLPMRERLPAPTVERALRYAFHFFFRRMIPLAMALPASGWPPFRIEVPGGLGALQPGRDAGLDLVCRGILDGTPFIYEAERSLKDIAA
jgi:hypothetical protein